MTSDDSVEQIHVKPKHVFIPSLARNLELTGRFIPGERVLLHDFAVSCSHGRSFSSGDVCFAFTVDDEVNRCSSSGLQGKFLSSHLIASERANGSTTEQTNRRPHRPHRCGGLTSGPRPASLLTGEEGCVAETDAGRDLRPRIWVDS